MRRARTPALGHPRGSPFWRVTIGLVAVALGCTNEPFDPNTVPNTRPVARIWVSADSLNETSYNHATFYWSATDVDGFVVGYHVSIADRQSPPTAWVFTTQDESTATYDTTETGEAAPTLYVVAEDDRGALSDTVSTTFPLVNFPPVVEFRTDFEPLKETFGAASFDFFGFDLDGDDTILPFVDYRYEGSDPDVVFLPDDPNADPSAGWVRLNRNPTFFSLLLRDIPPGDPGNDFQQTLYVRTTDEASASSSFQYTWRVFEVIGDVLLVDDSPVSDSQDAYYRDALTSILPNGHSVWDVADGLPERDEDLRLTLEQFRVLVWYTGSAESQNLLRAQAILTSFLTQDLDPETPGDQLGQLLLEAPVVVGNASHLSSAFRQRLGIAERPDPRNSLVPYSSTVEQAIGSLEIFSQMPGLPDVVSMGRNYLDGPGRYSGLSGLSPLDTADELWRFEPYEWGGPRDFSCQPDCSPVVAVRTPSVTTGPASVILLGFQIEFANALGNAVEALRILIEDHLGHAVGSRSEVRRGTR